MVRQHQTEYEATEPQPESTSIVGLDAGVTKNLLRQTVRYTRPSAVFFVNQRKLARLQRKLSRKIKFSANWQKKSAKFNVCILILPISGKTTFTKSPAKSAKPRNDCH